MAIEIPELYPPKVRVLINRVANPYFSQKGLGGISYYTREYLIALVELEPALYPLTLTDDYRRKIAHQGFVAMPWQYVVYFIAPYYGAGFSAQYVFIYWSKQRIKTLDDPVISALIPDIDNRYAGLVCMGNTSVHGLGLNELVVETTARLYAGSKNTNLHEGGWNIPSAYQTFEEWVAASQADPLCWLKWKEFDIKERTWSLRNFFPAPKSENPVEAVAEPAAAKPVVKKRVVKAKLEVAQL